MKAHAVLIVAVLGVGLTPAVTGGPANWGEGYRSCVTFIDQLREARGDAKMMYPPRWGSRATALC